MLKGYYALEQSIHSDMLPLNIFTSLCIYDVSRFLGGFHKQVPLLESCFNWQAMKYFLSSQKLDLGADQKYEDLVWPALSNLRPSLTECDVCTRELNFK